MKILYSQNTIQQPSQNCYRLAKGFVISILFQRHINEQLDDTKEFNNLIRERIKLPNSFQEKRRHKVKQHFGESIFKWTISITSFLSSNIVYFFPFNNTLDETKCKENKG